MDSSFRSRKVENNSYDCSHSDTHRYVQQGPPSVFERIPDGERSRGIRGPLDANRRWYKRRDWLGLVSRWVQLCMWRYKFGYHRRSWYFHAWRRRKVQRICEWSLLRMLHSYSWQRKDQRDRVEVHRVIWLQEIRLYVGWRATWIDYLKFWSWRIAFVWKTWRKGGLHSWEI